MDTYTTWIDIPVIEAIEYFGGCLKTFYSWANHYALVIGIIGLSWSCFKLINSRFTIKEFWWDTLYKWLLFILMMSAYPIFTTGLSVAGNKIGIRAGSGKQAIIDSLSSMKKSIEKDLQTQEQLAYELQGELQADIENFSYETPFANADDYNDFLDKVSDQISVTKFDSRKAKKEAQDKIEEYRSRNRYHSIYGRKTLEALNAVLIPKMIDGSDGSPVIESYVDLNIWLKNGNGTDSIYLSPAALLRVTLLGCQVLWEKNQLSFNIELDEMNAEDVNVMKKSFNKMSASIAHIPSMIMTMLSCIGLICCTIFAEIQYVMTILEYTIIMSLGAFFIPFILFDGTKEIPKKLIPVFTGFFIKMIVITLCLFYVFYLFIQTTVTIMADNGGMNWVTFATLLFNGLICFVLTQNAPKIAQTILTGQPQLSMGEFVQALGTAAFGARALTKGAAIAGKAVAGAGHLAKEGTRKAAQGYVNTRGGISKLAGAAKSASEGVRELGGTEAQARKAAAKGMFATFTGNMSDKIHNAGNNFLHGGGKTSGGSGGKTGGAQAHQRSGQNTSHNLGPEDSRTLNNFSNPNIKTATRFDETTQTLTNMRRSEFYDEKHNQGKNIGSQVALDMMIEAEKKKETPAPLPDNLTGNER
ncbi:MAG: type IV secretion system protein [Treponema sp.]|nr:type IV secretion system protein [Treponema sp.]